MRDRTKTQRFLDFLNEIVEILRAQYFRRFLPDLLGELGLTAL
ncbi:MAG: hypothetical protein ACXVQ5_03850 [Actinomycetota bacterium]